MTLAPGRQRLSKVSSSPPARNGYQLWWSASNADASAWPGRPDATTTASSASASVGEISFKVHTASKLDSELEDLRLQSRCLRRHGSPHGTEPQSDEGDDRGPGQEPPGQLPVLPKSHWQRAASEYRLRQPECQCGGLPVEAVQRAPQAGGRGSCRCRTGRVTCVTIKQTNV